MARTDDEKWLVVDGPRWWRTGPAVRTAANDAELDATRHRTPLAKVGLGERGTPWWEQPGTERRERWESALAELDELDDSGRQDQER
jgi:hypothetical protein